MKTSLACLVVFAIAVTAVESLEARIKVKFGVGTDPGAGTSYFFDVPKNTTEAVAAGWRKTRRPPGPLPTLVMFCPTDKVLCALFDDTEHIAGLQIAINEKSFTNNVFDWEERGFRRWNTAVDGKCVSMYTISQYFVSAESLKQSKEERLEARNNTLVLQENAVWLTGFNGELLRVSSEEDIINQNIFTEQACIPWMGQHWYYNMSRTTPCDSQSIYPWFPMTLNGNLIATGFMTFGDLPIGTGKDWFERPAKSEVEAIVPYGPQCVYDLSDSPGVLTMHIYYTGTPWLITC